MKYESELLRKKIAALQSAPAVKKDSEGYFQLSINHGSAGTVLRFLQADKLNGHPSDPGSWNKYAYVGGDPINRMDRQGAFYENGDDGDDGPGCCPALEQDVASGTDPDAIVLWYLYCAQSGTYYGSNPQQGGQPRTFQPTTVGQVSSSQEDMIFTAALAEADYLLSKTSCASLFPGIDAVSVLNTLASGTQLDPSQYGFIQWISFNATINYVEATTTCLPGNGQDVVLLNGNADGALIGDWQAGGAIDVALVLIHELGHVIYDQFGSGASQIVPDGTSVDPTGQTSNSNTDLVIQKCDPPGGPSVPGQN